MPYPNTNSRLESFISTGLSTAIVIEVDNKPVGAIQSLTITQDRSIAGIPEIGTDGFIERVPQAPTEISLDVERIVFDALSLPLAFGRPFYNIKSQRIPFTIKIYDTTYAEINTVTVGQGELAGQKVFEAGDNGKIVHEYQRCWFTSLTTTHQARDYIITQRARIVCEDAVTYFADGRVSAAIPSTIQASYNNLTNGGNLAFDIEVASDLGRRGSMDAAGLGLILNDAPGFGTRIG